MDIKKQLEDIDKRLKKAKITMKKVCADVPVAHSTVCQWKNGKALPYMRTWEKFLASVERLAPAKRPNQIDL